VHHRAAIGSREDHSAANGEGGDVTVAVAVLRRGVAVRM
jgi:hypothetical protein